MPSVSELQTRTIWVQWLPLAATWAMMAAEGLIIQSMLSRLPNASVELAAFGVAIGIAFIVESPIIMLLSASTAYVKGAESYCTVRFLSMLLSGGVTLVMGVLLIAPVYDWLSATVLALPHEIADRVYRCIAALIMWPGTIGIRRFYQGVLIGAQMSRAIAVGTMFRIATILSGSILVLFWLRPSTNSSIIGSAILAAAVTIEMIATWMMARSAVRSFMLRRDSSGDRLTFGKLISLYVPLALTSIIAMGLGSVLSAFMARFPSAVASLAAFPVVDGFVFQFRSPTFAYQEVAIALFGRYGVSNQRVTLVGYEIAAIATIVLGIILLSPLVNFIYGSFPYQLEQALIPLAITATGILLPLPLANAVYSIERARLIALRQTRHVTFSTVIEVGGTILTLALMTVLGTQLVGLNAASIAITIGKIVASVYLHAITSSYRSRRA